MQEMYLEDFSEADWSEHGTPKQAELYIGERARELTYQTKYAQHAQL